MKNFKLSIIVLLFLSLISSGIGLCRISSYHPGNLSNLDSANVRMDFSD
ncbi:hypothetical protein [Francisella sp. 19X1-34]|nr:hypothetical protein [Francisella sp. 19X1-34]MED7789487.1 hypothetical protein [Francisella sp. 19X1-34]